MGCQISLSVTDLEEKPVRLRLGDFDPEYAVHTASPEEFAIQANSEEKNILSMIVGDHSDRNMWLCSLTEEVEQDGFAKKRVRAIGARMNPAQSGLGYACCNAVNQQAQSNQDSWLILKTDGLSIYGLFDGHGRDKHTNFVREAIPRLIIQSKPFCYSAFRSQRRMTAMLKSVFRRTHNIIAAATGMSKLDVHLTGNTCIIIVHDHSNNMLYVAWMGDRGACISSSAGTALDGCISSSTGTASELTWDRKPWISDEKAYIKEVGGEIRHNGNGHLVNAKTSHYLGWNSTRSMGDLVGQIDAGLTTEPIVNVCELKAGDSVVLVLLACSNGVWEKISHAEALKIAACHPRSDAKGAADKIAKIVWDSRKNQEDGRTVEGIIALVIHLISNDLVAV